MNGSLVSLEQKNEESHTITNRNIDKNPNIPKSSYVGVDVFKFFFAICIVALHTGALNGLPQTAKFLITKIIFRVAVPYFFVASGFFLGKKLLNTPKEGYAQVIRAYCMRLLKPLVFFEVISLLYYGIEYLISGKGVIVTAGILVRSIIFYPYGALWYVQACIVGVLLLYPFLKRDKLKTALIVGFALYVFALISNNYSFLIANTPLQNVVNTYLKFCISPRNGLFTGFVLIAIGIFCSSIYEKVLKKGILKYCLVFFILYVCEILFVSRFNNAPLDDGSLYICHLFFVPMLFMLTLGLKFSVSMKASLLFRNLSTGIYFIHRPVLYILWQFVSIPVLNFIIVLCISILICLFTYKTRSKFLNSLLK